MDGQVIQSTTKKIVDVEGNRTVRDNKKYNDMRSVVNTSTFQKYLKQIVLSRQCASNEHQ